MTVEFKSPVSSPNVNDAFMSRKEDTSTIGKVDLNNLSSPSVTDAQKVIGDNEARSQANESDLATHVAENPAHKQQDTKANLTTWALTAGNGAEAYAIDEDIYYYVVSGVLTPLGGGSGGLNFLGTWDADTNTPTLPTGSEANGDYYVVSVAGSTNLDGITDWNVGDWAIYNGTQYQKIDNSESVTSVNGQQGAVELDIGNDVIRYYEDFERNNASSYFTVDINTSVSDDFTNPIEGLRSPNLAQTGASAGEQWITLGLDVQKPEFRDRDITFIFDSNTINAGNGDYKFKLQVFNGSVWSDYPDSEQNLLSGNRTNKIEFNTSVVASTEQIRCVFEIVNPNNTYELIVDKFRIDLSTREFSNIYKENRYTVNINAGGTVTGNRYSPNYQWWDSIVESPVGRFTIDYTSLGLTEEPNIRAIPARDGSNAVSVDVETLSNTAVTLSVVTGGTFISRDIFVELVRQGPDFTDVSKASLSIGDNLVSGVEVLTADTFNGKPVYRKSFSGSTANGTPLLSGVEDLVKIDGAAANSGAPNTVNPLPYTIGGAFCTVTFDPSANTVVAFSNTTYIYRDMIIYYTKV